MQSLLYLILRTSLLTSNMYLFIVFTLLVSAEALIVTVEQGTLNGTYSRTRGGRMFNAFYGIPYALPPIGELRFKAPKEAKSWNGTFDATRTPIGCIQIGGGSNHTVGSEDCLNLNVYSPLNARKGDNIPVIVYLFGAAFKSYTSLDFGPEYMLDRDVILVEPNFRLGALGFMSTGDTVISGNYQLKDQSMALKWVQRNIKYFGGNSRKVTLQGHSAGSQCVQLHTMSTSSKGLFHRAIMQSGSTIDVPFGVNIVRAIAKEFALKAGCPATTSVDIRECLMKLDARVFPIIEQTMYIWDSSPDAVFKPVVEDKNTKDAFITEMPSECLYHTPDMPWMIGLTTAEAGYKVADYLSNGGELAAELDQQYKILFPITLWYAWNTRVKCLNFVSKLLRISYFGNRQIGEATAHEMTQLYTDALFGVPIMKSIYSYPGPKYVYWYDYKSNYSRQNTMGYYPRDLGVCHGEELYLLFYTDQSNASLTQRDVAFSEELVKRWMNFVDTGNPNFPVNINENVMVYWNQMTTNRIEYLRIKLKGKMETDLYKDTYEFWTSLPIGNKYRDD